MSYNPKEVAWTNPRRIFIWSGLTKSFGIKWKGDGTLTSPTCTIYHNGEDVSSSLMTTGSDSVTGRIQVSKNVVQPTGGELYVLLWKVTDGNVQKAVQTEVEVGLAGSEF